jgi:putative tryptophan/tyrosine transport system substrate-binding protein
MRRREFIAGLGGIVAWPVAARAQQPIRSIGLVSAISADRSVEVIRAFRQGLSETGYDEGRNLAIEYRWANGHSERLPELADDLVRRGVAAIAAFGDSAALAAQTATRSIPIVFVVANDAVVAMQTLPKAADNFGLKMPVVQASTVPEIEAAFASLGTLGTDALLISGSNIFNGQSERLGALSLRFRIPAMFQTREFVAAGGLFSYGANPADTLRLVGTYTGRVLKGEKPADLPVIQATKLDLMINLKTAKAFSLTIPEAFLLLADEVIE